MGVTRDLETLARELKTIAEEGYLPDGDGVTVPVGLWAEGWLLSLAELTSSGCEVASEDVPDCLCATPSGTVCADCPNGEVVA